MLNIYVLTRTYISKAVMGSGYFALMWSSVVLLGGFVSSVEKIDFWCLTVIFIIEAAGIFNDWENSVQYFGYFVFTIVFRFMHKIWRCDSDVDGIAILGRCLGHIVLLPFLLVVLFVKMVYMFGPLACAAISSWRIGKLNQGNRDGTDSTANMITALDIFYSSVIFQGTMFGVLLLTKSIGDKIMIDHLGPQEQLPKEWGYRAIRKYLSNACAKCSADPASINGMTLRKYAIGLLDSEFLEDYLFGVRILSDFIKKGGDIRSVLVPSGQKTQRLIDTLRLRSSSDENKEIRELTATIVADLAGHIYLDNFPRAIQCISSLLQEETIQTNWHNKTKKHQKPLDYDEKLQLYLMGEEEQRRQEWLKKQEGHDLQKQDGMDGSSGNDREGGAGNELILLGLIILERLATNHHNRRDICSAPDLLHKITAPVYCVTLIQDIKKNSAWADVVNGTLKVLYTLIQDPGNSGRILRHDITTNKTAVSNLMNILDGDDEASPELQMRIVSNLENIRDLDDKSSPDGLEMQMRAVSNQEKILDNKAWPLLQMRAMEILTELALDLSMVAEHSSERPGGVFSEETKENLIKKLLQIFLAAEEPTAMFKTTAGRNLALLSTHSETSILAGLNLSPHQKENIVVRLTELLDAKNDITCITIAAEILENLCTHSDLDKHIVKEKLLPKVLTAIKKYSNKESPKSKETWGYEKRSIEFLVGLHIVRNDEGYERNSADSNDEESPEDSAQGDRSRPSSLGNDDETAVKELQEALLSLVLTVCANHADDFDDMVEKNAGKHVAFVENLKTMVEKNYQETTMVSLKLVKLCGQIAVSLFRRQQYTQHFKDLEFVKILAKAKETMSKLESCMLYAGNDRRLKKTSRPLLSDLQKDIELLGT